MSIELLEQGEFWLKTLGCLLVIVGAIVSLRVSTKFFTGDYKEYPAASFMKGGLLFMIGALFNVFSLTLGMFASYDRLKIYEHLIHCK